MTHELNYSIIIPHKNIPELLQRCLDSIPRRDDIQIIVVDDNSDQEKVDFKNFPCLEDSCVEIVFSKEGKGAGYARNVGLTKAIGKWILFADADDYFNNGLLDCLDKYKESSYDLIYFGVNIINAETKQETPRNQYYKMLMKDAINNQKHDTFKYFAVEPWGKLIKRSLINENNILFDEIMVSNDVMFSIKTAYYAKSIFFDMYKIYTYEILMHGSLTSNRTLEAEYIRLCLLIRVNAFLISNKKKKYKTNIIPFLFRLIKINNMTCFYKGIDQIKKNEINLFL